MLYEIKTANIILIVAVLALEFYMNEGNADEIDLKFGGFVKINAALASKGVNGIDDALTPKKPECMPISDEMKRRLVPLKLILKAILVSRVMLTVIR